MEMRNQVVGVLFALGGAILFSAKAIFAKYLYAISDIDYSNTLVLRMGFALPFYIGFAIYQASQKKVYKQNISKRDWSFVILLGLIGYYFASYLDLWGLKYISAGMERLILFAYPTITTILAAIVFKRKLNKNTILSIILTYIGISIAFWDKATINDFNDFWQGAILVFGSALTFSFFLIGSEKLIPKIGSMKFTSYTMIVSCLITIIHFGIQSEQDILGFTWQIYAIAIGIATISTVLPSFMMSYAIKNIGASNTAITSSVGPIWVLILAYFVLEESFSILQIAGTLVVIIGVWLISKSKK